MKNDTVDASSGEDDVTAPVPAEQHAGALAERSGPSALQVARGAGGLGVVWGGAWAGISGAMGLVAAALGGLPLDLVPMIALNYGVVGLMCGAAFALILTTTERRGTIQDLGYLRMSLWGAVGGFVVGMVVLLVAGALHPLGLGGIVLQALRSAGLGAFSASATTWLAKSAAGEGDGAPTAASHDGGI